MQVFFATNNRVKQWDEIAKLASLNELKSVLLSGNPIYGDRANEENHPWVVKRVPQIEQIDGFMVSSQVRKQADEMAE